MLEAAGLEASGPAGLLRVQGLGVVWLAAIRAWDKDETEDLSATMAALDRALDQADRAARMFRLAPPSTDASATDSAEPAEDLPPEADPV
jgi:hypothetical protein